MPWQQQVADVGLEYDPETGLPAYPKVVVTVPRQSGKTVLCLSWMVWRAMQDKSLIAYTAQTGQDAKQKLVNDFIRLLADSPLRILVSRTWKSPAYTAIEFKNGSKIEALTTSEEAGHGKTIHMTVMDEAFAHEDNRLEQALIPAMLTIPDSQQLIISTAGTEKSVYLKRQVESGRAAVAEGQTEGVAYTEFSADRDSDYTDPEVWKSCMPGIGYVTTVSKIRDALVSFQSSADENGFRRAYLNEWTASDDRIIPAQVWAQVVNPKTVPTGNLVFGVDVNPERTAASVGVCDTAGNVELASYERVSGLVDRVTNLSRKHGAPVAIDNGGPAASIIPELKSNGVLVLEYNGRDLANACGRFFDLVADQEISVRPRDVLEEAVAGATRRALGDAWAWGRRQSTTDISPLVAITLAVDAAVKPKTTPDPGLLVYSLD